MSSVASVAVVHTSASIAAPPLSDFRTDAELVALGDQLERLIKNWRPVFMETEQLAAKCLALAEKETGIIAEAGISHEQYKLFSDAARRIEVAAGLAAKTAEEQILCGEIEAVISAIDDLPAASVDGLRAKTLATIFANIHLWNQPFEELEYDERKTRHLVETCCALSGLEIPSEAFSDAEGARAAVECDAEHGARS